MLVPVVAFPVSAVPALKPLRRASGRDKVEGDRDGSRRGGEGGRSDGGDRRNAPQADRAIATSSAGVLSALLDLPRGG